MDTVYKNINGRFIERGALISDEYGNEVTCPQRIAQLTLAGVGCAALFSHLSNDSDRSSFPYIDLPCVPVKAAAFPKCP